MTYRGSGLLLNPQAVCPTCKAPLTVEKGTISRRWTCATHGLQGGDKVVDWVEESEDARIKRETTEEAHRDAERNLERIGKSNSGFPEARR